MKLSFYFFFLALASDFGICKSDGLNQISESLVIVGCGAAGTYLAWRLATAGDSKYAPTDISLYERTDHISGRLYSPTIGADLCTAPGNTPDTAHLPRTELGGMRVRTKIKSSSELWRSWVSRQHLFIQMLTMKRNLDRQIIPCLQGIHSEPRLTLLTKTI